MADFAPFHLLFRNFVCLLLAIHTKRELKMYLELLLSAKVLTSLYELGLTLLTRYQPFLLPLFLLLN